MNRSDARATKFGNVWVGEYRLMHSTRWRTVSKGGKAIMYQTSASAECAAWRMLHEIQEGTIVGGVVDPVSAGGYRHQATVKQRAEAVFRRLS